MGQTGTVSWVCWTSCVTSSELCNLPAPQLPLRSGGAPTVFITVQLGALNTIISLRGLVCWPDVSVLLILAINIGSAA